jgi:hypothetical protein
MLHLPRLMFLSSFPTALLRRETLETSSTNSQDVEFRLVEIGNIRRVQAVERLLKRKHRLESVALVEFGFEHRNTGIDQAV